MTKEEAIENIKLIRFNAAITNANSFKEALDMAIETLSQPSLPSNLDEAAEEYGRKEYSHAIHFWDEGLSKKPEVMKEDFVDSFKAGAEWMAGQFQKIEGELVDGFIFQSEEYYPKEVIGRYDGELKHGDKVKLIIIKVDEGI